MYARFKIIKCLWNINLMQNILSYSTKQDDIIQVGLQFNFISLQFIYLKN